MPDRQQSEDIDVRSIGSKAVNLKEENQKKKMQKNEAFLSRKRRVSFFSSTSLVEKHDGDDESANLSRKENFKSDILFFYVYIIVLVLSPFLQISFPFHFLFFRLCVCVPFYFFFFSFLFTSRFVNGQPGRDSTFPTKQSDECATQLNR